MDTPHWLGRYVQAAERVQKQRQAQREKTEAAQARLRPVTNPVLPPLPTGSKKEEERRDQPHPLLQPPSFPPGTPVETQMLFIDAFLAHRDHAHDWVRQHREAAAREQERLSAPHPLTQHPYVHIPIPERKAS